MGGRRHAARKRQAGTAALLVVLMALPASAGEGAPEAPPDAGLHLAALRGDVVSVRRHVEAGTDLDARDPYGSTALSIATTFGHADVARALLEGGADAEVANPEGSTALHVAALFGRVAIVEALLEAGADRHARNDHGSAPIDLVAAPVEDDRSLYDGLRASLGPLGLRLEESALREARPRIFRLLRRSPEALASVEFAPPERDGWAVASPEAKGLARPLVAEFYDDAAHLPTLNALLVVKDGALVAERYFNDGARDRPQMVQSVTKSFVSALVGIAIAGGHVSGPDARLLDFFPEEAKRVEDPRKRGITLGHLLAMRAGYPWEETTPEYWKALLTGDYVPCLADLPLTHDPDTVFQYSNVSSHLLGVIVARAADRDLLDFANASLFGPLGITPGEWYADERGYRYGHALLCLTARDMARFGCLYLDDGRRRERQVVPADWVRASLEPRSERVTSAGVALGRVGRYLHDVGYGYQWWRARVGPHRFAFAWGHGGQLVVLLDAHDLVIVTQAEPFLRPVRHDKEAWKHERSILNLVGKFLHLLPASEE